MDRYIGLDAHAQTCTLCVMGPSGRRLGEHVVETNGKTLIERMRSIAGDKYVVLEEGTHSEWLYEVLEPHAKQVWVTQPLKRAGSKSDSIDGWELADRLRRDALERTVFKSPKTCTALRQAARGYLATRGDMVRAKLRLHALFRSRGMQPNADIYDPDARESWLGKLPPSHRPLGRMLGEQVDALTQSHGNAETWLLEEAKRLPIVRRLATAPGMGPIRAPLLVAIVVTPARFRTTRQFWSYSGLGIVTRSSSDWARDSRGGWSRKPTAQTRGLNRNRHPELKAIFKGAATTIIGQMPSHPLHQDFQRMTDAGIKPNLAKLTLARRIAAIVLAMWKHQEDYDPSKHATRNSQPSQ